MTQNWPLVSLLSMARGLATSPENASVNSLTPANGMTLRDFPTPEACRRSRSEFVVIVRDPEHYLLGCFVIHLLGQDSGFLGSQLPMFWIVEMRDIAHGSGPFLGPTL